MSSTYLYKTVNLCYLTWFQKLLRWLPFLQSWLTKTGVGVRGRESCCRLSSRYVPGALNIWFHLLHSFINLQLLTLTDQVREISGKDLVIIFLLMFIYLFGERESMCKQGRGRERWDRDTIPGRFCTVSTEPSAGLDVTNHEIMTSAEIKSDTQPTEPPRCPLKPT